MAERKMAERKIYCKECGRYVGTIKDAKLMKGLGFVCPHCNTKSDTPQSSWIDNMLKSVDSNGAFGEVFGDLFGKSR
jgi:DNA-directed RNA polymerase subunit RPC12/RpoP